MRLLLMCVGPLPFDQSVLGVWESASVSVSVNEVDPEATARANCHHDQDFLAYHGLPAICHLRKTICWL